jgi:hypothetical protein
MRDLCMHVRLNLFSTRDLALAQDHVYSVTGRWILDQSSRAVSPPTLNFQRSRAHHQGEAVVMDQSTAERIAVTSFGVVKRCTKGAARQGRNNRPNLTFVMSH